MKKLIQPKSLAFARHERIVRKAFLLVAALTAFAYCVGTALAGSFSSTFTNPNQTGFTLTGSGTLPDGSTWAPTIAGGLLTLVTNTSPGSQAGTLVLDDLDAGQAIQSFNLTFSLQFGPGSTPPADGLSINFGPDVTSSSTTGEEGVSGPGDFVVEFDTYDNGAPDNIGIDLKVGGTELATTKMPYTTLVDGQMHPVSIQLNQNGTAIVVWNNQVIYTNLVLTGWAPVNGQFMFGARTGNSWENCIISNLTVTTTLAPATPAAPTITAQPQSQSVNEPAPVTFSVGYDGTAPFTFQWSVNGVADPAGTNNTYTIPHVLFAQNGAKVHVVITNPSGNVTSSDAIVTVVPDKTPPTLVGANSGGSLTTVTITASELLDPTTASIPANYTITPSLAVSSAVVSSNSPTVQLTTASMTPGTKYTLSVSNVKDLAGNPIVANSTEAFYSAVFAVGVCTETYFLNSTGNTIAAMQADPRYTNGIPDYTAILTDWEYPPFNGPWTAPASGNNEAGDNYFNIIKGWFIPPTTGNYVFFTCSDDPSNLYLSTDDTPANRKLIAQEANWANPRQWVTSAGGSDVTAKRSDQFSSTEWPTGNTITLTAGKRYFMESDHTEGGGGDNVDATYIMAGTPDPVDGSASTLTGAVIATTIPADGLVIGTSPTGSDITPTVPISATLIAGLAQFNKTTVTLKVDGAIVAPAFTTNGNTTTVTYTPPSPFALASAHQAELDYPLANGATTNVNWSFTIVKAASKDLVGGVLGYIKGPGGFTANGGGHTGKPGDYAIDSTPAGGTWIDIENVGFLNNAAAKDQISLAFWMKRYDIAAGSAFWGELSKVATGTDLRGLNAHVPWSDDTIYWDTAGCCDTSTQRISAAISTLPTYVDDSFWTNWHHFVFTKNLANKNIYIDGKLFLNGTSSDPLQPNFVYLALLWDVGDNDFMHGLIDDFAVYSTEISATDAASLAGGSVPNALTSETLIAYWNFDDATPIPGGLQITSVTASSGNIIITWTGSGTLQSAPTIKGPWTPVTGKTSPATVPLTGTQGYFEISQ